MPHTSSRPELHYSMEGDGAPVVLAHALGCDAGIWDGVIGALSRRHTVIRYDARCHGRSGCVAGPFAMADLVTDLERLLDELRLSVVSMAGLSMGGMAAMGLAIAAPARVRKLVLANTTSRYPEAARALWTERIRQAREQGMAAVEEVAIKRLFAPGFAAAWPQVVAHYRDRLLRTDPRSYAECCEAVAAVDFADRLHEIAAPTLVIAGGADVAAPVPLAEALASSIPGARLSILDGAGHLSPVEQPAEFAARVLAFLEESHAGVAPSIR